MYYTINLLVLLLTFDRQNDHTFTALYHGVWYKHDAVANTVAVRHVQVV